jgi:ceramide synthetase
VLLLNNHPATMDDMTYMYYMCGLGFYSAELVAIFIEPKRKDFLEYFVHHLTAIFLVTLSFAGNEHRVGTYVFFIHDIVDIPIGFAKMANYANRSLVAHASFGLFVCMWAYFRLWVFPHVCWACLTVAPQIHPSTWVYSVMLFALATILQSLHVMWFVMMLRMIVRLATTTKTTDVRSDSGDDEPAACEAPKKASGPAPPAKEEGACANRKQYSAPDGHLVMMSSPVTGCVLV